MTMGPYGVHYERTQTWWGTIRCLAHLFGPLPIYAPAGYSRCGHSLFDTRGGSFCLCQPRLRALDGTQRMPFQTRIRIRRMRSGNPDREGFGPRWKDSFSRVASSTVYWVLPNTRAMTLRLLEKVESLIESGCGRAGLCTGQIARVDGLSGL